MQIDSFYETFDGFTDSKIEMTKPLEFSSDVQYKSLTLMTGYNGSGKSLLNKLVWAASTFYSGIIIAKLQGQTYSREHLVSELQFILDNTFDDNNLSGEFGFMKSASPGVEPFKIEFSAVDGKVTDIYLDIPAEVKSAAGATYLSKEARNFSNIDRYIKTKKLLNITDISSKEDMEKLTSMFKLYDVLAIEQLIAKITGPVKHIIAQFPEELFMTGFKIIDIQVENDKLVCIDDKGNKQSLSSLSEGTQSIISMLLTAIK